MDHNDPEFIKCAMEACEEGIKANLIEQMCESRLEHKTHDTYNNFNTKKEQ